MVAVKMGRNGTYINREIVIMEVFKDIQAAYETVNELFFKVLGNVLDGTDG